MPVDPTTELFPRHPITSAPHGEHLIVRGPDGMARQSFFGKVLHVAIYRWLDFSTDDPENTGLLRPAPTEWRYMVEEVDD